MEIFWSFSEGLDDVGLIDHAGKEHHDNRESAKSVGSLGNYSLLKHGTSELDKTETDTDVGNRDGEGACGTEGTEGCDQHEPDGRLLEVLAC